MRHKYAFTAAMLVVLGICCYVFTSVYVVQSKEDNSKKLKVVTSFYPMYIAAANVIGDVDTVSLKNLSEPQTGCLHDYQLTPEDMKLLSKSDVFIINGGGIEGFLSDVAKEYPNLTIINASKEVGLLGENAHAWMSISDYRVQLDSICEALSEADKADADLFAANTRKYQEKLQTLQLQQQEIAEAAKGSTVISFHEAYEYMAEEYGFDICNTLNLDEERQVSAAEVSELLTDINEENVSVILAEELYGSEMAETVKKEAPVEVWYLETLVRGDYQKDSYIKGMQSNIDILKKAFGVE